MSRTAAAVDAAAGPQPGGDLERALGVCLRELNRREQTAAQVRRRLERTGTAAATIEAAVAWLVERRYLDDAGYAERFACDRRRLDGWGSERIGRRLAEVGIDPELIEAALGDRDAGEELTAALAVLEVRLRGASGDARDRRRALGLLARRGYGLELAAEAVSCYFGPL